MSKKFFMPFGFLAIVAVLGFFTSCQKEDGVTSVENFTENSVRDIQERHGAGRFGCYELVFPVTIQFADTTSATVNSYEELRQAIRTWFEANGGNAGPGSKPTLVFPYQVINRAGEIITVENLDQLAELQALCRPKPGGPGNHGGHGNGHGHHGEACYTLVFPLTVQFADSTQVTVASSEELKDATRTWNENNPGSHSRPEFVFPLTVTLKDGTQVIVNSADELKAIKDACRG